VTAVTNPLPVMHEDDPPRTLRDSEGRTFRNCICVALMLPLFDAELRKVQLVIRGVDIMQGGYNTTVAASAKTHHMGGVFDMRPLRDHDKAVRIGNSLGLIVFVRLWPKNIHYHVVVLGCPHQHAQAEAQLSGPNGYLNGGDGLAVRGPYQGPRGLAPNGGWQEAYARLMTDPTTPRPATSQQAAPNKDADMPTAAETTSTIDHAGNGWAIKAPLFKPKDKSTRYIASARVTAEQGTVLRTRFVAWNERNQSWYRYPATTHATHEAETSFACHTAEPNTTVFVDVFADRPGQVLMHTSTLLWEA
jgi:hypothetical protein